MKVSLSWLSDYIDLGDLAPAELAGILTMAGLEVEDARDRLDFLATVVSAKVVRIRDLGGVLRALELDVGEHGRLQVLCGDPSTDLGLSYPLALLGTELPAGVVKEKVISGFASQGVLCSEADLGLSAEAGRVMPLNDPPPGSNLKDLLGLSDVVLDVSVTPNRADALCMIGVARDLSALLNRPLRTPEPALSESDVAVDSQMKVSLEDPDSCFRYAGRVINGVAVRPSPAWLAARLFSAGLRPVNNIVDVTNYVMLEMGLPLHAFDLSKLEGPEIIVKVYGSGEKFTTLDGQERELKADKTVMICDKARAVAIGGIMGGLNTEVDDSTADVFLEGACFNQAIIRRASRALGLSTDASYRFERGMDPNVCGLAVDRAAQLMAELGGGSAAKGRLDAYPRVVKPKTVRFSAEKCNSLLGTRHKPEEIERTLKAIGVELEKESTGSYLAKLPTFRPDLTREVDLIEEVSRLVDFASLPATLPKPPGAAAPPPSPYRLRQKIREVLCSAGFFEALTYSFINMNLLEKLGLPEEHSWRADCVRVLNPISEDHGVLRPSLLPGLLSSLRLNQYHGSWDAAIFEAGNVFLKNPADPKPLEKQRLGVVLSGQLGSGEVHSPKRGVDFWDIKGVMERLGEALNLELTFSATCASLPVFYEPGQAAVVFAGDGEIGHLGLLSQATRDDLGLKEAGGLVYLLEMELDGLSPEVKTTFKPWSNYPGITRDLAIVLARDIPVQDVLNSLDEMENLPLAGTTVFDLYQGDKIPADKKSLALRLFFQERDRTLTDEQVNGYFDGIVAVLAKRFSAALRS
ncbi:MAG: phenylalanine--tRNA ligase subunit beta [Deltaproteobacteria bacterium]|jgi:phenylalanyl-tRNA synthetase beta chain|nr:phenylalanine--tRNA ligase subunit beta [Deltaproteobacteria bacterium]